jgi:Fe-S-cluster containining protein
MENKSLQLQALPENKSLFQNSEKKEAYLALVNLLEQKLPQSKSLPEFYQIIQEMILQINTIYENIQCKTGCSRCCKFYGSPQMYQSEWEYIKNFLEKNFDEKQIKRVYRKFKENIDTLKDSIENAPQADDLNEHFSVPVFLLSECPFLYKGSCSIYEARPIICRIFGNSLISRAEQPVNKNVLTCTEERERWETENNPAENIYLPDKEYLESFLVQITKPEEQFYNTIQFWLTEYFNEY